MLGKVAVTMWWDVPPEMKSEWEDWHSHEHMPERLGIPGFLRGTRWIALSGEPSYFVLYEAARLSTIVGGAYLERLNNPTPWSRKMMPHHRNMVRSVCRVEASFGAGLGHALLTVRLSPEDAHAVSAWLTTRLLPAVPSRKGLVAARLLRNIARPDAQRTTEQRIRGGDAAADWIVLINGYSVEAVASIAAQELNEVPGAVAGLYRLAHVLTEEQ